MLTSEGEGRKRGGEEEFYLPSSPSVAAATALAAVAAAWAWAAVPGGRVAAWVS